MLSRFAVYVDTGQRSAAPLKVTVYDKLPFPGPCKYRFPREIVKLIGFEVL